jgi:hypothetical protein
MVIPESWNDPRVFWERLADPVPVSINAIAMLVEPCRPGFIHAVTPDDVARVLGHCVADASRIAAVVLRQPTRKQLLLASVWGRLAYFAELGSIHGPAVILEAHPDGYSFKWPRSLSPDEAEELERLRNDGHEITSTRRAWTVHTTRDSVRNTQLFRTLPHEVGHLVQYDREVRQAASPQSESLAELQDRYFTKPLREKEDFAHRYAREFFQRLSDSGRVPFPRIGDTTRAKYLALDPAWFGLSE